MAVTLTEDPAEGPNELCDIVYVFEGVCVSVPV